MPSPGRSTNTLPAVIHRQNSRYPSTIGLTFGWNACQRGSMRRVVSAQRHTKLVLLKPQSHHKPRDIRKPQASEPYLRRQRFALGLPVRFQPLEGPACTPGTDTERVGLASTLSAGGICLLVHEPPPLRQVAKISVPTPIPEVHVQTLAEVRWQRHLRSDPLNIYSVGMKFLL